MPLDHTGLQTPWLRDQLIEWLLKLGGMSRPQENWDSPGDAALDHMLDFFDDTGLLDDPVARIGFILRGEGEAQAMRKLGSAIDQAIQSNSGSDVEVIRSGPWESVTAMAREALRAMAVNSSHGD